MRVQKDGHAKLIPQTQDELPKLSDALGIESIGRLVEEQTLRLRQKRLGKSQTLSHAMTVGACFCINAVMQVHQLHDAPCLRLIPVAGKAA